MDATRTAEFGWFTSTSFGVNYSDRTKDKQSPESGLSTIDGLAHVIDPQYLLSPTNLSYADAGEALAVDVYGVLATYFAPIVYGDPESLRTSRASTGASTEKVLTASLWPRRSIMTSPTPSP